MGYCFNVCKNCGKEFERDWIVKFCCDSCRKEYYKKSKKKKGAKKDFKSIEEIQREARALHMTYGQYMAYLTTKKVDK